MTKWIKQADENKELALAAAKYLKEMVMEPFDEVFDIPGRTVNIEKIVGGYRVTTFLPTE